MDTQKKTQYLNKSRANIINAVLEIQGRIYKNSERWEISSNRDVGKDSMNLVASKIKKHYLDHEVYWDLKHKNSWVLQNFTLKLCEFAQVTYVHPVVSHMK